MSDGKKIGIAVGVGIGVFALVGVILAIVMAVMGPGVLGGVGLNNNGQTTGGEGEGGGGAAILDDAISNLTYSYKAAYRTENVSTDQTLFIDEFATEIINSFTENFGAGGAADPIDNILYYDSIRYSSRRDGGYIIGDIAKRWNWTFDINQGESETDPRNSYLKYIDGLGLCQFNTSYDSQVEGYYQEEGRPALYQAAYSDIYLDLFRVILYDILLNKNIEDVNNSISVNISYNSSYELISFDIKYEGLTVYSDENGVASDLMDILEDREDTYLRVSDYFGFGDDDKDLIASYILDSIIGPAATQDNLNENRNYQAYVTDLVDSLIDNSQPPSSTNFAAYPRTSFVDTGVLALDIENAEPFHDIVSFEYQSIIIMPDDLDENEPLEVGGFEMTFESSRDMTIKMFVRFFDKSSGTITTTAPVSYDIDGGTVDLDTLENTNDEDLLFDNGYYDMFAFDNNEIVKADSVKVVDTGSDQQAYKMLTADDGSTVTVFNEAYATSDFWEIVFQVEKDPLDPPETDYSFKVAVYNVNLKD